MPEIPHPLSKGLQPQEYTNLSEGYQPATKGYQPNSAGQAENSTPSGPQNYGAPPQGGSSVSANPNATNQKKE